jgi:hypothetical protein
MKINLFKTQDIHQTLFEVDENGREINIYELKDCAATGINLFYPNVLLKLNKNPRECVLPLLERTMSLQAGTVYEKNGMTFECSATNTTTIYTNPLFFFIYNTDNYFHFLYDSLPYLISFLSLKKTLPALKLLMQYPNEQKKEIYPFVLEFLALLNITSTDIILINKETQYETVYISTSYTHDIDSNLPPRREIYEFYQDLVKRVKERYLHTESNQLPKKLYVSRRTHLHNDFSNIGTNYTTRRKMTNEDDLVAQLLQAGYTEVFTEKLTTIEKIIYFANATHVVGAIGGGISNVLFSPPTTKLEAIVSPTFLEVNQRFKYSLDCVNVAYNENTEHTEHGQFKRYMRVKSQDGKIIGEIEDINENENTLLVSYTSDASNTGWNAQNKYQQIKLNMKEVEKLDKGLNSAWRLIINK